MLKIIVKIIFTSLFAVSSFHLQLLATKYNITPSKRQSSHIENQTPLYFHPNKSWRYLKINNLINQSIIMRYWKPCPGFEGSHIAKKIIKEVKPNQETLWLMVHKLSNIFIATKSKSHCIKLKPSYKDKSFKIVNNKQGSPSIKRVKIQ